MNAMNSIKAIIILQIDGRRTLAKYFDPAIKTKQFERHIYGKTKLTKSKDTIIYLDGVLVVHRFITDSHIYIVGDKNDNPAILESVMNCLVEVISSLSTNNLNSNTVLDNRSSIISALDEICDEGMILEVDPNLILQRITYDHEESVESMAQRTARRIFGMA